MKLKNTPSKKQTSILRESIAAVKWWIEKEWSSRVESPALKVVYSSSQQDEEQMAVENAIQRGQRAEYPVLTLILTVIQERRAPFCPWQTHYVGLPIGYTPGRQQLYVERVKPVEVGIGVRFQCLNLEELVAFSSMWIENLPSVAVDIQNKATGAVFRINMNLGDGGIQIPQAEQGSPGEPLITDSSLIVGTYAGQTELINVIKSIQVGFKDGFDPNESLELDSTVARYGQEVKPEF